MTEKPTRKNNGRESIEKGPGQLRRSFLASGVGAVGLAALPASVQADEDRPVHGEPFWQRSVNIHPRWQWDGGRVEVDEGLETVEDHREAMQNWLDVADKANVNALAAWVETSEAAAMLGEPKYAKSGQWPSDWDRSEFMNSRYSFWDPDRWDAMGELIEGANERGIEVHLWTTFTRYKRDREMVPEYDPDLEVLPPGDPDWASVTKSEYEAGHTDPTDPNVSGTALCNNEHDAHEWTLELYERLFDRYPGLAGLRVEEPGYLSVERCVCHRCQSLYSELFDEPGENLLDHMHDSTQEYYDDPEQRAVEVKVQGTNAFVEKLDRWWNKNVPEKTLSFNGSYHPESDRIRGRNWAVWSEQGLLPYYSPQVYTSSVTAFEEYVQMTMEAVDANNTKVAPTPLLATGYMGSSSNDPETVINQIKTAHNLDGYDSTSIVGVNLFRGFELDWFAQELRDDPFRSWAHPPWHQGGESGNAHK